MTPPPRLTVLLAPAAGRAVVIRQGPTKVFATLGWDLTTDAIAVGQWCKHKLYAERCDLSPDGRWLVYFALNGAWASETRGSWTGLARAPYLKAVRLWPQGDTWGGGGLFYGRAADVPDGGGERIANGAWLRRRVTREARLARDGWTEVAREVARGPRWLGKACGVTRLETGLGAAAGYRLRAASGEVTAQPAWGWADVDPPRRRLLWAEAGVLYQAAWTTRGLGVAREVFDARGMSFAALAAPYDDPTVIVE